MAASNRVQWIIDQGATFKRRLEYTDANGDPIDLTDYNARMHVRPESTSTTIYFNISTTPTSDGTGLTMTPLSGSVVLPITSGSIGLTISAYSSSLVSFDQAYFDVEIYSGSGQTEYVRRIIEGRIKLNKNTTR